MELYRGIGPRRVLYFISILTIGFFLLLTVKGVDGVIQSMARSRLVASVVHEQLSSHPAQGGVELASLKEVAWSDELPSLELWLLGQWDQNFKRSQIEENLTQLMKKHAYSSRLKASLERWKASLRYVDFFEEMNRDPSPEALFFEAKHTYFESEGLKRIGRRFDAVVLDLWASQLLGRFIRMNPESGDVPQALFMLGATFVKLNKTVAESYSSSRIFNLCSELYPYSIWSKRANAYRRNEIGNGV